MSEHDPIIPVLPVPPVPEQSETPEVATPLPGWNELGLSEDLLKLVKGAGFEKPTPVQAKSIPWGIKKRDLLVSAQTGSGKTAAFVFPMVERFRGREGTYGLVLAPSREIALQTKAVCDQFGAPLGVRSICLIGGIEMRSDDRAIATYPQIIVATPGRLCDHLERGNIWLDYIEMVVLDEADRMLDMGFSEQLNRVLQDTPKTRQTLLFSATMPESVGKIARKYMVNPERIAVGKPTSAASSIEQHFVFVEEENKIRELQKLLRDEKGSVFIFMRSKLGATKLWRMLRSRGFYDATHLHSDLRQSDREQALEDFKDGKFRVMIATDVIGRGIHVNGVAHVVNFDLPMEAEDYIHRIGRTGRADATGKSTSFITRRDRDIVRDIEKLTGKSIGMPASPEGPSHSEGGSRGGHPSRGGGQGRRRRR